MYPGGMYPGHKPGKFPGDLFGSKKPKHPGIFGHKPSATNILLGAALGGIAARAYGRPKRRWGSHHSLFGGPRIYGYGGRRHHYYYRNGTLVNESISYNENGTLKIPENVSYYGKKGTLSLRQIAFGHKEQVSK